MRSVNPWPLAMVLLVIGLPTASRPEEPAGSRGGRYTVVVEGYDWGPGVSKVILSMGGTVSSARAGDYSVAVKRRTDCAEIPAAQAAGERLVVHAYVSDAKGQKRDEGEHVTLVLGVAPEWPLGSPFQYARGGKCSGNVWVDYALTVTEKAGGRTWDTEAGRIRPLVDRFDLAGRFA
ncbi:MAG TPA: glucan-binding protein, partial [Vicinamibacteria bacterium]